MTRIVTMVTLKMCYVTKKKEIRKIRQYQFSSLLLLVQKSKVMISFFFFWKKGVGVGVGGIEEMYLLKFFIFNFFKYFIAYSW